MEKTDDVLHVVGGKPLNGTIKVRGAKNFVSKAMVAALLAPGTSVLKNVPEIRDVHVVSDLLRLHGVNVDVNGDEGIVTIDAKNVQLADVADVDTLSGSSRIPILFSGPAGRGVHPGARRLQHWRPADRLPFGDTAQTRRHR